MEIEKHVGSFNQVIYVYSVSFTFESNNNDDDAIIGEGPPN